MTAVPFASTVRPLREILVRDRRFFDRATIPRQWHPAGRAVSRFFDNLSLFFPDGERFFMHSLQAHRRAFAQDAALSRAVRDFCAQEGIHGREHEAYNRMLTQQGIDAEGMQERVRRLLARVKRLTPPRAQLAATCALEHYTASMGRLILSDPRLLEGADPAMAALWRWHAAEENEHKAVAYDVYLAAGGGYVERSVIMLAATAIFWAKVLEHQVRLMRADGDALSAGQWGQLAWFLYGEPGALRGMWRDWLRWFGPGFHPDDFDDEALLAAWRATSDADGD